MRLLFAVVLTFVLLNPSLGDAQIVSFGVSVGVPINQFATAVDGLVSMTGRHTFGPALRVSLPRRFAVDVDLLYKRLDFGFAADPARIAIHRVELPLMLRYAFRRSLVHPFVHAGMSFNRVVAVGGSTACTGAIAGKGLYCIEGKTAGQLRHQHTHGPVLGAGVDFGLGALRLAPELRVTRWVDRNLGTRDSSLRSNLTQVELLLGLKF